MIKFWLKYLIFTPSSGCIDLITSKTSKFKVLKVIITGEAECKWRQFAVRPYHKQKYRYHMKKLRCAGKETFYRFEKIIYGNESEELTKLKPGVKSFNFQFSLPNNIPGSFKSDFGFISYSIEAICIGDSFASIKQSPKLCFNLEHTSKENVELILKAPMSVEMSKCFSKIFGKTDPLTISVNVLENKLSVNGNISMNIAINNKSGIAIKRLKIKLVENTIYSGKERNNQTQKVKSNVSKEKIVNEIINGDKKLDILMEVPLFKKANICEIIKFSYEIQVLVETEGFHSFPILKKSLEFIN